MAAELSAGRATRPDPVFRQGLFQLPAPPLVLDLDLDAVFEHRDHRAGFIQRLQFKVAAPGRIAVQQHPEEAVQQAGFAAAVVAADRYALSLRREGVVADSLEVGQCLA